jgi:hypothetical protein
LQRLKNKLQLSWIELKHRLLEVSHAAVHQLRASAARPGAKVLALDQRHAQPSRRRIYRASRARGTTTNDEHVTRLLRSLQRAHSGAS